MKSRRESGSFNDGKPFHGSDAVKEGKLVWELKNSPVFRWRSK